MGNWHRVVGIDLGTTFSAVAAYNYDKNDVRIVPNRQNEPTTPSVVYIGQDGQVSVGRAAKEKLARDPKGVILEVKRLMGERSGEEQATVTGRQEYEPELISAHILRELKAFAEKYIGEPIHDAVITVPAYFNESQRNATKEAARIARINPLLIINEPTAAAIAYAIDSGEKQTFIVYDFGGGTFDVSIVRANSERSFDVLGTGGDARLGGGDIDQKIVDWVLACIQRDYGRDMRGDLKTVSRIRLEAEKIKINICNEGAAQELYLDNLGDGVGEVTYRLEVAVFEEMVRALLDKTLAQVDIALGSAKSQHELTLDDVEAFILVGGSSKIPMVSRVLKERYQKPIKSDLNPDEVVASGAAWMGKGYTPSLGPEIRDNVERRIDPAARTFADHRDVKDVVSHTLGVGLKDDVYDRLIAKDTVIPFNVVRDGYTNAQDNQTSVVIPVYQGESSKASINTHLGEVVIPLTPEPKGTHRFAITFGLDVNAIFKGEVKHHQTGKIYPITLDRGKGQITEKRRIDLSDMVNQGQVPVGGSIPASPPPTNPIEQLIRQATENLYRMPPDRQQEISALLIRLDNARKSNDTNEQAAIVAQLTMSLMRSQPAF